VDYTRRSESEEAGRDPPAIFVLLAISIQAPDRWLVLK